MKQILFIFLLLTVGSVKNSDAQSTTPKTNKDQYFTVKYTNGQGHCVFTSQQTGKAFDELRSWTKTGRKAKAGFIQ